MFFQLLWNLAGERLLFRPYASFQLVRQSRDSDRFIRFFSEHTLLQRCRDGGNTVRNDTSGEQP